MNIRIFNTLILSFLLLFAASFIAEAQLVRAFTPRFSLNARGKIKFVSNVSYQPKQGGLNSVGTPTYNAGKNVNTNAARNDKYQGGNIDIDSDPTTFNSTSADFTLPACGSVAFAGLYWGTGFAIGQTGDGGTANGTLTAQNINQVKLKVPGSSTYSAVTANVLDSINIIFSGYQGFADVTALVNAGSGTGTYTVANVACDSNKWNSYGGWTLVMVYRDSTVPVHNLTVFDGVAVVGGGATTTQTITITGFKAPPTGQVNALLGAVVYDGDLGPKDGIEFKNNSTTNTFIDLTSNTSANTTSASQDAWNSTISYLGNYVTNRNPNYQNTFGYDVDIFNLYNPSNNYLRNNDQSATIRIASASETFVLGVLTTELDNFFPTLAVETRSQHNNDSLVLGDTITFTSVIRNIGSDVATDNIFRDKFNRALKYIPNSTKVNGVAITDAAADDVGEYSSTDTTLTVRVGLNANTTTGGSISTNAKTDSVVISYKVKVSASCSDVGETPKVIAHQSSVSFKGQGSGAADVAPSRPQSVSGCIAPVAPDPLYLKFSCINGVPLAVKLIDFNLKTEGNENKLCWQLATDGEAANYTLLHSTDGRNFEPLYFGTIAPRTNNIQDCHTHKTGAANQTHYYRLKISEANGSEVYSRILKTANFSFQANSETVLTIVPNPVNGAFAAKLPVGETAARLTILSLDGRVISSLQGQESYDSGNLPAGTYLVQCTTVKGTIYVGRFVKM